MKYSVIVFILVFGIGTINSQVGNLSINEVLSSNHTDLQDDFSEYDDWLEIYYEAGSSPAVINLAGYYLSDNPNNLTKWEIPNTNAGLTSIVSGQHLLFWIDKDPEQGEDHVDFKLSSDGETVFLSTPDSIVIDSISLPQQYADISYGRECDGCDNFVFFNNTTPDNPNQELNQDQAFIFINEVMFDNESYIDDPSGDYDAWIEIYNPNDFQVNLSDYSISNTGDPILYEFPSTNPLLTVVPANSYLLIWCDNEGNEGENHSNLSLASSGTITLTGPTGLVDSYIYSEVSVDHSWGRQTDGSIASIEFTTATPRVTNSLVIVEPEQLFINEVLSANQTDILDNHGETEDWFEIYNPNVYEVNIAGYYISDNPENPMKFMVPIDNPDSTTIAAGGWMLFFADEDGSQGIHHTNFRLNNNAEELTIYSPDGFSQADHIEFSNESADVSLGRNTDGEDLWVHFSETTPDASNNGAEIFVSVVDAGSIQLLKAWPNPVIGGTLYFSETMNFKLVDSTGSIVENKNSASQIDLSGYSSGIYFIRTNSGATMKVVIQ